MTPDRGRLLIPYLALVLGILCIGFGGIFVKLAGVPGTVSAFYRIVIAAAVILPCWLAAPNRWPTARDTLLIVVGGLVYALDNALWNASLLLTSAATATLLANSAPLWVGLVSFLWFRERLPRSFWIGMALALAGTAWLLGGPTDRPLKADAGSLLAIGSSLLYAAYLLITQRARARVDLLPFMAVSLLSGAALLLVVNLVSGTPLGGFTGRSWLSLAVLGLVSQLGGWLGINYALGHLQAAPVSVWLLGQVVVTALAAMPLLGEVPGRAHLLGGALVLAGIVVVTTGRGRERIQAPE